MSVRDAGLPQGCRGRSVVGGRWWCRSSHPDLTFALGAEVCLCKYTPSVGLRHMLCLQWTPVVSWFDSATPPAPISSSPPPRTFLPTAGGRLVSISGTQTPDSVEKCKQKLPILVLSASYSHRNLQLFKLWQLIGGRRAVSCQFSQWHCVLMDTPSIGKHSLDVSQF